MIPDWMKEAGPGECGGCAALAGRKDFIGKSIGGVAGFFRETMVSEDYARRKGLLQALDPRAKLISVLALVVAISLTADIRVLAAVYALTLVFAFLSGIGIWFFIGRVWLFIPLFTGAIALPLIFNVFFPGDALFTLATLGGGSIGPFQLPETLSVTRQGLLTAAVFTLRVACSVSAVVLLFLTTRQDALFKSLRSIGVPKVYVLILDMCYRYIFLFMDIVRDLYVAKKSRTIRSGDTFEEQKWVGGRMGYTLVKTLDMSEKVHNAMVARGFTGDVRIMQDHRMRGRDYIALAACLAFSAALVLIAGDLIRI
jgi:cobalt/nickel transport system permease protein